MHQFVQDFLIKHLLTLLPKLVLVQIKQSQQVNELKCLSSNHLTKKIGAIVTNHLAEIKFFVIFY